MEKKESCNTCKNKGLKGGTIFMFSLGLYILGTSIYGNIELIKNIINYFS